VVDWNIFCKILIIVAFILTDRLVAIFEEIERMPTPPPFQSEAHSPPLIPSKLSPFSPSSSSITEPSSPPGDPKEVSHKSFTPEDYQLLVEKVFYLEERLKETVEMQVVTSQKLAEALEEVDRLRFFMKREGRRLIQGC
jgi:hypothetical protein